MKIQFELKEYEKENVTPVEIDCFEDAIFICPKGYGTKTEEDGNGAPILIERWEGKLRVVIWNNINLEDPIVIDMEGAREFKSRREE